MFGVSHFYELVLVLIIALVLFGPRRLPELGASLGRGIREFRSATREIHEGVTGEASAAVPTAPAPAATRDDTSSTLAVTDAALPPHSGTGSVPA
jgi:sec-independent protein translocase protein TatA